MDIPTFLNGGMLLLLLLMGILLGLWFGVSRRENRHYEAPCALLCNECGQPIKKGAPILFDAMNEAIHENCSEA